MTHRIRYAARTDRGLVRANNQDSVFAGDRLLVIADGMGGHAAGDVASRLVVEAFMPLNDLELGADMRRPLISATREGNGAIADTVEQNPEFDGMGTTLTALFFDGPTVALAHVGDSRAYLYRNGVLHQISHDDTFVQSLVDDGRITSEEAAHHPQRSLLLRALNGTDMDPSVNFREISPGDRFLICSDGLSDYVAAEAIADALEGEDPDQVADALIQLALAAGAPDNVTVIVADVLDTGATETIAIPALGTDVDDPDATGPLQPIHETQRMRSVPLPPIPEEPGVRPDYAPHDDPDSYDGTDNEDGDDIDAEDGVPTSPAVKRRWPRRALIGLVAVVVIAAGVIGTYVWAGSKYYVGSDDSGRVVVWRGVDGSFLGWHLASVQEMACSDAASPCTPLRVQDLQLGAQSQVSDGINVDSLSDAHNVLNRLVSQNLLPICGQAPAITITPSTSATTSATAGSQTAATSAPSGPPTGASTIGLDGTVTATVLTTVTLGGVPTTNLGAGPASSLSASTSASSSSQGLRAPAAATTVGRAGGDSPQLAAVAPETTPSTPKTTSRTTPKTAPRTTPRTVPTTGAATTARTTVKTTPRTTPKITPTAATTSSAPIGSSAVIVPPPTVFVTSTVTQTPTPTVTTPTTTAAQTPGVNCRTVDR